MSNVQRLLDANANRAREALRVMEDAARFLLDDAAMARSLKGLRHDLTAAVRSLGGVELYRDTPGDVGTAITTESERSRRSTVDVARAAGKRLGEALRCLEEYAKLSDAEAAARFERCRYRAYEIERQLIARLGSPHARQWGVCVLITESLCEHHAWLDVARAALDGGVEVLQLREPTLDDAELLDRALALRALVDEYAAPRQRRRAPGVTGVTGAALILNNRADLALAAGADGVHLGQADLPIERVRRIVGPDAIVGVSTHALAEAQRAVRGGADYCGVGAVYDTATKRRKPSGLDYVRRFAARYGQTPHLAIGGVTPGNVAEVLAAGARGVAVSSCVCAAKRPATVARRLVRAVRQAT